jgi:hypothetical protein
MADDPDTFTETTTTGWGGRIGQSIVGVFVGILLVPVAIVLLYCNEGRAVEAISALDQGLHQVAEVTPDAVLPANDGRLVHLVGQISTTMPARDPAFAVSGDGLLRLRRKVEMYQWKEDANTTTQQSMGGSETTSTTYSYHRVWSETAIDSGAFHHPSGHVNPVMPMTSITFDTSAAMLGAYHVDRSVLDEISDFAPLAVANPPPSPPNSFPLFSAKSYQAEDGGFYQGRNPANPAIGDLRVSFASLPSQVFSIVATQIGGTLTPYHAANSSEIALIKPGAQSAAALFSEKKKEESAVTWVLRGVGFIVMLVAFALMATPMATLFAVVPLFEGIVEAGTLLVALTLAVPATLVTIAIAWAAHRPFIGGALLAAALGSLLLFSRLHKAKAPRAAPAPL